MTNILIERLPVEVEIDGINCPINFDFHDCLRIILAFEDPELTGYEKQMIMLENLYPTIPANVVDAIDQGMKFLNGGKEGELTEEVPMRLYSFDKDADFIFSAFKQTHGIDLEIEQMHWWKFLALFMDLGADTVFCNLVSLRKRLKDGMASKEEKQAALGMGNLIDIPELDTRTLEEREKEVEFMQQVVEAGK